MQSQSASSDGSSEYRRRDPQYPEYLALEDLHPQKRNRHLCPLTGGSTGMNNKVARIVSKWACVRSRRTGLMRVGRGGAIGAVFIVMAEVRCLKSSCGYEGEPDVTLSSNLDWLQTIDRRIIPSSRFLSCVGRKCMGTRETERCHGLTYDAGLAAKNSGSPSSVEREYADKGIKWTRRSWVMDGGAGVRFEGTNERERKREIVKVIRERAIVSVSSKTQSGTTM